MTLPMKSASTFWKWPVAMGMVLFSLVPITLLWFIYAIDFRSSWWAFKHLPPPFISESFHFCIPFGFCLPILTAVVAGWFAFGGSVTTARLAWSILLLAILHLFWLSWGILGFYLVNQKFVMF
jgi:hypothetical protein